MLNLIFTNLNPPVDAEPEDEKVSLPIVGDENLEIKILKKVREFVDFDDFDYELSIKNATQEEIEMVRKLKGITIVR